MKSFLHAVRYTFTAFLFLLSLNAFAQLPAFTLTVTPTPQTCLGNGSLSFAVAGTAPGAAITYAVYLVPNTGTPITTTSATTVNSLAAGSYIVVATQTLNGESNTATANATITNNIVPLQYTLVPGDVTCNNNGVITVNVTSGIAVSYEITAGPVIKPLQTSNVFTGLPVGLYQVRVYDNCGEAVVVSVTLIQINAVVNIGQVNMLGGALPSCTTIQVSNLYSSPYVNGIIYPITLTYTVFPPGGGAPTVVTQTVSNGTNEMQAIGTIPFYYDQQYYYNLVITDACGNVFTKNNNIVNTDLIVTIEPDYPNCEDKTFTVVPSNYVAPYTITFTASPPGFIPVNFNSGFPVFTSDDVQFGAPGNPVPDGTYTVQVLDACGHTGTATIDVAIPPAEPQETTTALCGSTTGDITIVIPNRLINYIQIIAAPAAYTGTVPGDVSAFLNEFGAFEFLGVPLGDYVFYIIDNCGDIYETFPVTLQPSAGEAGVTAIPRAGCNEGEGSVRVYSSTGLMFAGVVITAAPAAYTGPLPDDVSENVNQTGNTSGQFYMNSLPEGDYTIQFTDQCGFMQEQTVNVVGYHEQNEVTIIPHCGSFDINLVHSSTGSYSQSFWLQKYDPVAGTWGHPVTGIPYTTGLPSGGNSVLLANNTVNINNAYTGEFRIVKNFYVFSNGSSTNFRCFHEIYTFTFDGGPQITNAVSFPCGEGLTEVAIEVTGVPPFTYAITSKNGDATFTVDNGGSNLFSGLEPANYNFQVTDNCGNVRNRDFTITEEPPILITATGFCEGQLSTLSAPDFTFLDYQWYEQGNPGTILSTTATLSFPAFNSANDAGTYMLQIIAENPESCLNQTLQYTIAPNSIPNAGTNGSATLCNDGTVLNLTSYLGATFDTGGTWTDDDATGALAGGTFSPAGIAEGTYHFTYTVNGFCNLSDTAIVTITLKDIPALPVINSVSGVCTGADIQLSTPAITGATYAWTGPNNFTSSAQNPLLTNVTVAQGGDYHLTVTVNGCSSATATASIPVSTLPYAGTDGTDTVCNSGTAINLSAYLGAAGTFTAGGTWTDNDASGGLTAGTFNTSGIVAGTYHFTYTVVNFCNVPDSATITITLNNIPAAPVVAPVAALCEGSDISLAATAVAGATYAWTGPNGFTSAAQNPVIVGASALASGTYSVTVTVNGCTSPAGTTAVNVHTYPQFALIGDDVLCDGQTITLTVSPSNFNAADVTYKWYLDGDLQTTATTGSVQINETGLYEVTISNGTCETTESHQVSPNTNAFEVLLDAGCVDQRYIISITNLDEIVDVASVSWTGPDGFTAVTETADITDGAEGIYIATVTTLNGCSATAEIPVDNTHCFIPRGISPGDGEYNDNFDLSNLEVKHLKIFNRYGMEVYEKDNYINEWYGQSDKGDLPTGTYYYVITLSAGKQVTGWVYLLKKV
jgi:gliding motility-associated-like protein